jgi:hypothetical protein
LIGRASVFALGALLALSVLAGCGGGHRSSFCGLAYPGFEPVAVVHGMSCRQALAAVGDIESDQGGGWTCSRAMHAAYELDCRSGPREVRILESVPVRAKRHGAIVTLANWSFRIAGGRLQARQSHGWIDAGGPPFCVTDAPRPVLIALRLRPETPHGGCFRRR